MKKILALLLAVVMVMALAACGGGSDKETAAPAADAPAAAPADDAAPVAPAAPAEEGDASGEPSGDPTGDPPTPPELAEPTAAHTRDLEGYRTYAIEALNNDPNVPDGARDEILAGLEAATSPDAEDFGKLIDAGLIMNYEDFLAF